MRCNLNRIRGFTLLELLVVVTVIGVMVGLLLPAVQSAREAARRMSCSNQFKQIGLGIINYHAAFDQLPIHGSGTIDAGTFNWWTPSTASSAWRLSLFVGLTPFIEQQSLWEQISQPAVGRADGQAIAPGGLAGAPWPTMGPTPEQEQYIPWRTEISTLRCPSDPGIGSPSMARTNYSACLGDSMAWQIAGARSRYLRGGNPQMGPANLESTRSAGDPSYPLNSAASDRGVFVLNANQRFGDISDGLANTIAMGEIATDLGDRDSRTIQTAHPSETGASPVRDQPSRCGDEEIDHLRPRFWDASVAVVGNEHGRGFRWADTHITYSGSTTILPPNREICGLNDASNRLVATMSSRHQGGCHVLMADGAIRFVTDSIDAGNEHAANVYLGSASPPESASPYGLWGALGTRGSKEIVPASF